MQSWMNTAPVVVGGVGGSGTRVLASMLNDIGYYIGSDLNEALDNLWFTQLFKRPRWYDGLNDRQAEMRRGLRLFEKIMKGEGKSSPGEYRFLLAAFRDMMIHGHDHLKSGRGMWAVDRCRTMLNSGPGDSYSGWGWKEPNTHIFLEHLVQYFPDMKYILVIRHGLDMAYSRNQAQLHNWGGLFGVEKPNSEETIPGLSLAYWIKSNQRALSLGKKLLGNRFCVVNFDQLQNNPDEEVEKVLRFLHGGVTDSALISRLSESIHKPPSSARHQNFDLSCFSEDQLDEVRKLGFPV